MLSVRIFCVYESVRAFALKDSRKSNKPKVVT